MKHKQERGLLLRPQADIRYSSWWQMGLARLLYSQAFLLVAGSLTGYTGTVALVLVAAILCLVWTVLDRQGRGDWFPLGTLAVLLVLTLILRRQLTEGFRLFWNAFSDTLVTNSGYLLPRWRSTLGEKQGLLSQAVFTLAVALAAVPLLGQLAQKTPAVAGVVLLVVTLAGAGTLGGGVLPALGLPALMLAVFLPLFPGVRKNGLWAVGLSGVIALVLLAACVWSPWQLPDGTAVRRQLHSWCYDTEYTTLPEGDLAGYVPQKATAQPALMVTMEQPQTLYLRGFTAERYENGRWTGLESQILAENKELLSWLNENAFSPNAQFEAAAGESLSRGTVTVRNTGVCSRWMYVPYQLCAGTFLDPNQLNQNGVNASRRREYTYEVLTVTQEDLSHLLAQLQKEEPTSYRKAESAYREFVRAQYLQIPQEIRELLEEDWQRIAWQYGDSGETCAVQFLRACFPEEGESEIQLPLENAAGTSYQYATVAVMTLRRFGIPSRYVEGYVISQQMAQNAGGGVIQVDSSCARAWVEVYQDGIGWIPMELTPGLGETAKQVQQPQQEPEEEEPEEETQPQEEEPQPDTAGGSVTGLLKRIWLLALVPALLLLALLALVLRRRAKLKKRDRKFQDPQVAQAVGWIFADGVRLLERVGIHRENGSLRQLAPQLEARFGGDYVRAFLSAATDNDRALFSGRKMEEQQRLDALAFHAMTVERIKTREKWLRRLWMKWILCLY